MSNDALDDQPHYEVQEGEQAEADRSHIFLRLNPLVGPERASEIYTGLQRAMLRLAGFPGPKANAVDQQATALYRMEVRRALYDGPLHGRRRLSIPYRILYTIIEPEPGQQDGIMRILRVLHGSQELNP